MQICCFVISLSKAKRQGSLVVANATGTGPNWHAIQQRDAPGRGEGRDEELGFRSKATPPADAFTLQPSMDCFLKILIQKCLGLKEEGRSLSHYLSSSLLSVKSPCKWMTKGHAQKLAHACQAHASSRLLLLPSSSLHHLALSRSARLLTTCASAGPALAPGLIVHW